MSTHEGTTDNGAAGAGREDSNRVLIFDTTLRDGEQSPGISLNKQEKREKRDLQRHLKSRLAPAPEAGFSDAIVAPDGE